MKNQEKTQVANFQVLQGNSLNYQGDRITKSEIKVKVLNANTLRIEYSTLDCNNPMTNDFHVGIWKNSSTPPYGNFANEVVAWELITNNNNQGQFDLTTNQPDVNFYNDLYCIGLCLDNRAESVCAYATLSGGVMALNFEPYCFVAGVSTEQVSVSFTTPIGNNPNMNHQYIDLYEENATPGYRNCLSVRGGIGIHSNGQIVLNVKQGSPLKRGGRYKVMFDFNGNWDSYGCEFYFVVPE